MLISCVLQDVLLPLHPQIIFEMTKRARFAGCVTVLVLAVGLIAGCGRGAERPPAPVYLNVSGSADMNSGGNAAIVRVYLLASDASFRRTNLEAFWQDDAAALGSDLVGPKREILLYPGESEEIELNMIPGVSYIGIAADLRNPDPNSWREIYPVAELGNRRLNITIGEDRLDVRPLN